MGDYNNFWDPEYWTPEGYRKRKEGERNASKKLAVEQHQNNVDTWGNIGKAIGDGASWLGQNFGGQRAAETVGKGILGLIPPSTMPKKTQVSPGGFERGQNALDALRGKYNSPGIDGSGTPEISPIDRILSRLGEEFTFDESEMDTSHLDEILNSNKAQLNGLRDQTRGNFETSDRNIQSMHDAFRNDQMAQAPRLQQEGDAARGQVEGIFNKTISANDERLSKNRAEEAEMLQRLGIAPAANQPDLFGAEVQRGINTAQAGRDARTSEITANTQTNLNRNSQMATAIGNEGNQRRSELSMRLNEILGNIDAKEADFMSDYQRSKMELRNNEEDQAYQRWIQDRQFDMGLFDSINEQNTRMAEAQAKGQQSGATGIAGLNAQTSPELKQAVINISRQVDIAREPQKAMKLLSDPKYGLDPEEVFNYVTSYGKLGTNNKFSDVQMY